MLLYADTHKPSMMTIKLLHCSLINSRIGLHRANFKGQHVTVRNLVKLKLLFEVLPESAKRLTHEGLVSPGLHPDQRA